MMSKDSVAGKGKIRRSRRRSGEALDAPSDLTFPKKEGMAVDTGALNATQHGL